VATLSLRVLVLLVVAFGSGCRHIPTCVREGGMPWWELTSARTRIFTDLDSLDARLFAHDLGVAAEAMTTVLWPETPEQKRVDFIVFRDNFELIDYSPNVGVFQQNDLHAGYVLTSGTGLGPVLRHELAHALTFGHGLGTATPVWYVEGIASFLATVDLDYRTNSVDVGTPDEGWIGVLNHEIWAPLGFDALWSGPTDANRVVFYASSWLLIHYLYNHEREGLVGFQNSLADAKSDPKARWSEFFPTLEPARLQGVLKQYFLHGEFRIARTANKTTLPEIWIRQLEDSRVHSVMAVVSAHAPQLSESNRRKYAAWQTHRALAEDPSNLWAHKVERLYLGENRTDLPTALRLVAQYPSESDAWLILASTHQAMGRADEASRATQKARDLGYRPLSERPQYLPPRLE
jgi:hypothetical protein